MSGWIDLPTGVRLRYADTGGAGEPVLCLHGYTDSSLSFAPLLPLLPASWRVVTVDQRGHGRSAAPADGYGIGDFAADAAAALAALGIARATVVGHSMGSLVAQRLALDHPARVARLVLIGSTATLAHAELGDFPAAVRALEDPVPPAFVQAFQASAVHAPVPPNFMARVVAESLRVPARVWRAVLAGLSAVDHRHALGAVVCPTLVVWGERDAMFGRAALDGLLAALPAARVRIHPETGHSPHWERPVEVARDVARFVAETSVS